MKNFFLDLWTDLREKRLWPVAVVLLLGLIAVPVVLSKPAEQAPAPAPVDNARKAPDPADLKALTAVELDESAADQSSPLDTFDPSNPFAPPAAVVKRTKDDGSDLVANGGKTDLTGGTVTGGDAGGLVPGDGTTTSPTTPPPGDTKPKTTDYQWVIDASFEANGDGRRIKKMERLDMLPSEDEPLLLFLGVTDGGASAVFLVDSTLSAAGEGTCQPNPDECAFVYLGAGSEHSFSNDKGDTYNLRVNEIRKVKVDPKRSKASRKAKRSQASASTDAPRRRFVPTLISDLVSVSSADDQTSTPDSDRR
jgi:hypothetical protein